MTFDDAMELTRTVSSNTAFEDPECRLLFEIVTALPRDCAIIEIGCEYGRSSSIILQAAPEDADLQFIDPFDNKESAWKWMKMARETGRHFTLYCRKSEEVYDPLFFNLIHIDGDHSREGLLTDLDFLDYAFPGAYACFHDFNRASLPEVYPTVMEYMNAHPEWSLVAHVGTLGVFRKAIPQ